MQHTVFLLKIIIMNKICTKITLSLVLFFTALTGNAQVISFNTQALGVGYNGANSFNSVCFTIENTNPYPAVLTSVANYFAAAGAGNAELWYSASSIYGAPGTVSNPTWTLVATNPVVIAAGVQTILFPSLSFSIPANTTYRFYLATPTVTLNYTTAPGPTPNIFSNTGVNLLVGDYQVAGQVTGWAGAYPTPGSTLSKSLLYNVSALALVKPATSGFTASKWEGFGVSCKLIFLLSGVITSLLKPR